jgi:hypothetical protein
MSTVHARGHVIYGLDPALGLAGAQVQLWDSDGRDPDTPIWMGTTDPSGDFDGQATIRNNTMSVPKLDGSGHWDHGIFIPDTEQVDVPHTPRLKIMVTDTTHHTPQMPYVAVPDPLPAPPVPVPWGPPLVSLPQDDPFPVLRTERLNLARSIYELQGVAHIPGAEGVTFDPPIPMFKGLTIDELPIAEWPPADYVAGRLALQGAIIANRQVDDRRGDITIFDDYRQMYPMVATPRSMDSYPDDEAFAAQRLAGVHPLVIKQVKDIPPDFAVRRSENEPIVSALIGESLAQALAHGRIYLLDYDVLAGVQQAHDPHDGRYLPAPYALFYFRAQDGKPPATTGGKRIDPGLRRVDDGAIPIREAIPLQQLQRLLGAGDAAPDAQALAAARLMGPIGNPGQELVAIAIQVDRNYNAGTNPVVTRASGEEAWGRAKLMVQVADLNLHEMGAHLWAAHFAMEAFSVTLERNLDVFHPLHALLKQHFKELVWNNHLGLIQLVNAGGRVDRLLGTKLSGSMEIMKRARQRWAFDPNGLENDLSARGMDAYPGVYPYRDDARRIRDVIAKYVGEYVDLYYASDARVSRDNELQHWLAELRSWHVAGTPDVQSVPELKAFVTQMIFTSSAYHSAVNYAQYDFMGFVPNMPAAAWSNPHSTPMSAPGTPRDDELMPFYPPTRAALDQLDLVRQLTGFRADKLGDYAGALADPPARNAALRFVMALAALESAMIQDNSNRRPALGYYYMCPELVTNSTSV